MTVVDIVIYIYAFSGEKQKEEVNYIKDYVLRFKILLLKQGELSSHH